MLRSQSLPRLPRIAVIGGGISGLSAANRLLELLPQAELTLFDASSRLGGVIETLDQGDFLVERSADSFITKAPWGIELCRRLAMADQLLPTNQSLRRAMVVFRGRLQPVPDGFFVMSPRKLAPMLSTSVLSLRGKLRMLVEPFVPPRQLHDVVSALGRIDDESVASFVRRRLGREVFDRLVQPLLSGIYTADPSKLSMASTMPEFLEYERTHGSLLRATLSRKLPMAVRHADENGRYDAEYRQLPLAEQDASGARYGMFVSPRTGLGAMVRALEARLAHSTVRRGTRIVEVSGLEDGTWKLTLDANQASEFFDAVIVAVPAYAAAALLARSARLLASELQAIPYAGCAVVSLGFDESQLATPVNSFGFVVPQVEGRRIIATSFASAKFPGRSPAGAVLARTFVGGALQPHLLRRDDSELKALVIDELHDLLGFRGEPALVDIARWPRSMPQYHVGHLDRVERIERLASELPNLALAGNAYRGVGIPQCIQSGEQAAEKIAASWLATELRQEK